MTNAEKHKEKIKEVFEECQKSYFTENPYDFDFAVIRNIDGVEQVVSCSDTKDDCSDCIFNKGEAIDCYFKQKYWLMSEYENPFTLTENEKQFCEFLLDAQNVLSCMIKGEKPVKEDIYLCRKDDNEIYYVDKHNNIELSLSELKAQNVHDLMFFFIKKGESYRIMDLIN